MDRKSFFVGFALIAVTALGARAQGPGSRATVIDSGASCPPGTTEVRPRRCQAPEFPAPSILDYRPRSTLVVPAHPVPKAKFPAIDFHGHPTSDLMSSAQGLDSLAKALDAIGVRLILAGKNRTRAKPHTHTTT